MNNRLWNCGNPHQGTFKRVLTVCSAGLLRSPTAALVLSWEPYNFNTRACGLDSGHALVIFDKVLACWADEIICMTLEHKERVIDLMTQYGDNRTPIHNWDIPDAYAYRDPELIKLMQERAKELYGV